MKLGEEGGGGLAVLKMLDTVVSRRQKNVQLYWLKRFKIVPKKQNLDQKIKYSKSQGQQKLAKKITHFAI